MEIGSPDYFTYLTAATYWSLIVCWTIILGFYVREYRRLRSPSPVVATLLVVIFIDGARTLPAANAGAGAVAASSAATARQA